MTRKFSIALALLLIRVATATEADGPYVVRGASGKLEAWSVELAPQGARKQVLPVAAGSRLVIGAVGSLPAFEVTLRAPVDVAPDVVTAGARQPLFVVADTHGEYEILAGMLIKQGVVDDSLRWTFGRGRLVFLGDVFDRGSHQVEIFWLVYALEAQARQAGGAVYFVLGNHEVMALRGDARYLNAKYRETAKLLGATEYARLFDAGSVLGQWLRSKPTVLELGDALCLHGGISPALLDRKLSLKDINGAVRAVLEGREPPDGAARERAEFLLGESGPLWYRGYFPAPSGQAPATTADIDRIRKQFGVAAILVGHTKVPTITSLYEGRVVAVQVYPHQDSFGNPVFEALLIRDGVRLRAWPDGRTEKLQP
ncbi:MAG TPA: metallophosphoesterase [Steroidobacteraceae bacterium]